MPRPITFRARNILVLALAALALLACKEPTKVEEGEASYYADSLHGNKTASGEKYNKRDLTAAHRTIPLGTRVKVTNLDNGKSVWVRINDRGPHVKSRVIDVSGAAARKLDFIQTGTAKVRLEIYD